MTVPESQLHDPLMDFLLADHRIGKAPVQVQPPVDKRRVARIEPTAKRNIK